MGWIQRSFASGKPRGRVALLGLAVFCMTLVVASGSVIAHQSSFTYASIEPNDARTRIDYEVRLSSLDLFEALDLGDDRDATDEEIMAGGKALSAYVFDRIHLSVPGQDCDLRRGSVAVVRDGQRFAQVRATVVCPRAIAKVDVLYELFFDLDDKHEGLLRVGGGLVQFKTTSREFSYVLGDPPPENQLGFLISGANHVLFGMDHILFLLSLMMVMGLRMEGDTLRERTIRDTARNAALVATAFTVGHSITLVMAALGWIWLPSRFVESMIAASIVFVAVENVLRPDPPRRYVLTFAFGLMHGMGFASMLRPLLPPEDVVLPLLIFNVGVEVGQIVVLVAAIPVLTIALRRLGVAGYRRYLLPVTSLLLVAAGTVWFVERAFAL